MNLRIELDRAVPVEAMHLLRSHLAHCDESIERFDVEGAPRGFVEVSLRNGDRASEVTRKVCAVAARLTSGRVPPTQILRRVGTGSRRFTDNVAEALEQRGWLHALGRGVRGASGPIALLMRALDEDFRGFSLKLGASESRFPALLRAEFLRRIRYFESFPQYVTFAAHLRPDLDTLDGFMARMRSEQGPIVISEAEVPRAEMILSPTICYHLYDALSDTTVGKGGIKVTAVGSCFRWEGSNLEDLRRLWEFEMRELIFVGSKDLVLDGRDQALSLTLEYCEELGLDAWVENANDSFFSTDAGAKSAYQRGFGMKWELRLPYTSSGQSVAAASFNNMQRTFGESCSIRLEGAEPAFSGCVGWGIERWAYVFVAQHGLEPREWPAIMRDRCTKAK